MAGNYFIDFESDRLDDQYATDAELASGLGQKVNSSTYNTAINTLTTNINDKASANDVYTKSSIDTQMGDKVDSSEVYTKGEIDTSMDLKANSADVEADMLLKSDKASTFTKTEVNTYLQTKLIQLMYMINQVLTHKWVLKVILLQLILNHRSILDGRKVET